MRSDPKMPLMDSCPSPRDYSYILAAVRIYESVEPYVAALRIVYGGWLTNASDRLMPNARDRAAGPIATAGAPRPARAASAGGRVRGMSLDS